MSADAELHPAPGRQPLREMAEEVRTRLDPGNSRLAFGMSSTNRLMPMLGPGPGRSVKTSSELAGTRHKRYPISK
jgi:hypothetical protein